MDSTIISNTKVTTKSTMMTLDEIISHFNKELPDEINGAKSYLKMAKSAEEMQHHTLARGLYEMAHDEYTHAKFIREILIDNEVQIPSDIQTTYTEVEEHMCKLFR
jgi:ferritin